MRNVIIASVIFLLMVLQSSFFVIFSPFGAVPDLVLIFIIIWTARIDFSSVIRWAVLGGVAVDITSFNPIGINIFSFTAVAFLVNSMSKRFLFPQPIWKFITLGAIVFGASLINQIIGEIITTLVFHKITNEAFIFVFADQLWKKAFSNLFVFVVIYWPIRKLEKFLLNQNQRVVIKRNV